MHNLDMIDNRLNNTTDIKMIDSLIYKRKSGVIGWKETAEELRQIELAELEKRETLIEKLKRWIR